MLRTQRMRGQTNALAGLSAEACVAKTYERRGCDISNRRWRGAEGEIDLVARDGPELIFVEVKKSRDFAQAAQRLSQRQMQRIYASAEEYLAGEPRGELTPARFDVALVNEKGAVEIVENAFGHG